MNTVEIKYTVVRKVWVFPQERFVTYEPSDERWARPLGFGREEEQTFITVIPRAVLSSVEIGQHHNQVNIGFHVDREPVFDEHELQFIRGRAVQGEITIHNPELYRQLLNPR